MLDDGKRTKIQDWVKVNSFFSRAYVFCLFFSGNVLITLRS